MELEQTGMKQAAPALPVRKAIDEKRLADATQILNQYKAGKANLETRIIENEKWYRLRHWECMRKEEKKEIEPVSAWLFNSIANKHASAMDNFPAPNVLPREEGDKHEAEALSAIVPVVLERCGFEQVYSDCWDDKLIGGTGVYGVFWDKDKANGLGDVTIEQVDVLNLFWQPGVRDIQDSRNMFHVQLMDNEELEEIYPELKGKLGSGGVTVSQYHYDDTVDTSTKSAVIDWYYKRWAGRKRVLHYCKYVNNVVLFATENETEAFLDDMGQSVSEPMSVTGLYDHGEYPFVLDPMFKCKGTPCGFGFVDVAKNPQEYIDLGGQNIMMNMKANTRPRFFHRAGGGVNKEQYADLSNDFVDVEGSLNEQNIMPIEGKGLDSIYVEMMNAKVDELKETTGNRDISTGGTTSGVTAASAIAAMQEAGSKLDRDGNKAAYRAYRKIIRMVIELIRQFYDIPRAFRIMGSDGMEIFTQFSNAGMKPRSLGELFGVDLGCRIPEYDIEVTAQKASPYTKLSQNELALQFFGQGFFNPAMADQALACLDMMDFDRKNSVIQKIGRNGAMYQQLVMLQQQLAVLTGMAPGADPAVTPGGGAPADVSQTEALGGAEGKKEHHTTRNARTRVAESTAPL